MRILVIEDNPKLGSAIVRGLAEQGWQAELALLGFEGEERAASENYDLIVLDRMLPDRDGIELCRNLRQRKLATPILMLTALSGTQEKVAGLDAGADDYLTKPFEFEELLARVRALLRRGQAQEARALRFEDLELDLVKRSATRAGAKIRLSPKEFALLEFMMRHPERVLSRTVIMEQVWDMRWEPSSNVVDVYVSTLRRKLDQQQSQSLIHTVISAGYRFGRQEER